MTIFAVTQHPKRTLRTSVGLRTVTVLVEADSKDEAIARAKAHPPHLFSDDMRQFNKITVRPVELPFIIA